MRVGSDVEAGVARRRARDRGDRVEVGGRARERDRDGPERVAREPGLPLRARPVEVARLAEDRPRRADRRARVEREVGEVDEDETHGVLARRPRERRSRLLGLRDGLDAAQGEPALDGRPSRPHERARGEPAEGARVGPELGRPVRAPDPGPRRRLLRALLHEREPPLDGLEGARVEHRHRKCRHRLGVGSRVGSLGARARTAARASSATATGREDDEGKDRRTELHGSPRSGRPGEQDPFRAEALETASMGAPGSPLRWRAHPHENSGDPTGRRFHCL